MADQVLHHIDFLYSLRRQTGVALCMCGASKNKPFCDVHMEQLGFQVKIKLLPLAHLIGEIITINQVF